MLCAVQLTLSMGAIIVSTCSLYGLLFNKNLKIFPHFLTQHIVFLRLFSSIVCDSCITFFCDSNYIKQEFGILKPNGIFYSAAPSGRFYRYSVSLNSSFYSEDELLVIKCNIEIASINPSLVGRDSRIVNLKRVFGEHD
jgi:hypothetical protein